MRTSYWVRVSGDGMPVIEVGRHREVPDGISDAEEAEAAALQNRWPGEVIDTVRCKSVVCLDQSDRGVFGCVGIQGTSVFLRENYRESLNVRDREDPAWIVSSRWSNGRGARIWDTDDGLWLEIVLP